MKTRTAMTALGILASALGYTSTSFAAGPYDGYDALLAAFDDEGRKDSEFVIVPGRLGDHEPGPPHNQYANVCWMFATQTANEYLGFALHRSNSHHTVSLRTQASGGFRSHDIGYWGSPEHMLAGMADYLHRTRGDIFSADYYAASTTMIPCHSTRGADYGTCSTNGTVWGGFEKVGDGPIVENSVAYFNESTPVGCNDYRDFGYTSARRDDLRRIIKAFVDNNTPFVVNVSGHNHTVIGYADIGPDGLPRTSITTDAHTVQGRTPRYYAQQSLDTDAGWRGTKHHTIYRVRPRNQHLNGGCAANGWATELDASLSSSSLRVCPMPANTALNCNEGNIEARFYGITVQCWNDGALQDEFHATPENPFITVPRDVACDQVVAYYNDGRTDRRVTSSRAWRYGYRAAQDEWVLFSSYTGTNSNFTRSGHGGRQNQMAFNAWKADYGLVLTDVPAEYTKRRTTLELTFDTGEKTRVELSPPGTYGIEMKCHQQGALVWSDFLEADHNKTTHLTGGTLREYQNAMVDEMTGCDTLDVRLALGTTKVPDAATVTRHGYHTSAQEWRKINASAPWAADSMGLSQRRGLSGGEYSFAWSSSWPTGYALVGEGFSGAYSERKSVIDIAFADGSSRSISISPH